MKRKSTPLILLIVILMISVCALSVIFGIPAIGQLVDNIISAGIGTVIATAGMIYVVWTCVLPLIFLGLIIWLYVVISK